MGRLVANRRGSASHGLYNGNHTRDARIVTDGCGLSIRRLVLDSGWVHRGLRVTSRQRGRRIRVGHPRRLASARRLLRTPGQLTHSYRTVNGRSIRSKPHTRRCLAANNVINMKACLMLRGPPTGSLNIKGSMMVHAAFVTRARRIST